MATLVLGCDPGATGAIALYSPEEATMLWVKDMPHVALKLTTGKNTKRVDIDKLVEIFQSVVLTAEKYNCELKVHIEKVNAFGKQSAPAAFNFGYAACAPLAIARTMNIETHLIHAAVWKRAIGLQASEKDDARLLARQLFPAFKDQLRRKQDVDRADAMFLAAHLF